MLTFSSLNNSFCHNLIIPISVYQALQKAQKKKKTLIPTILPPKMCDGGIGTGFKRLASLTPALLIPLPINNSPPHSPRKCALLWKMFPVPQYRGRRKTENYVKNDDP